MKLVINGEVVNGIDVGSQTRCAHYSSDLDIIAIKFKCCGGWFPCFECHSEIADHEAKVWPQNERETSAILCGACGYQLSVNEYLRCDSSCPACKSSFNPGCSDHYHLYFA